MKTPKLPLRVDAYWPPPKVVDAETPEQIAVRIVKAWKRTYQDHVDPTESRVTREAEIVREMLARHGVHYQ